jgi:hypothetical protein
MIEYQSFKDLEDSSLKKNKCISFYLGELRKTNIQRIDVFLKFAIKKSKGASGVIDANIGLIELEAIDIMDRLYAFFTSRGEKLVLRKKPKEGVDIDIGTLLYLAAINLAICLYSLDWEHEYLFDWLYRDRHFEMLETYNDFLPIIIEALDYRIFRPSLAHLGLSIARSLDCYRSNLVPSSYQAGEGECLI